ncbi:type II restriction endonuclease [Faecalicoccus acidiformans]|uniref:Restriction endonuclease n=1 Tax=Faecalicoccus acidiformans TaxID=915173 RepID=A0ABS2FMD4_9FIRM|nr:type II restriction endonuclease [Faecalicoccus acidiformans]MBM6831097.1 restriction endonuclease [Faecalicoccus acidiformans]
MCNEVLKKAINSVLNSKMSFCKFLTANDTGATGGHQVGILISKSASDMMFTKTELCSGSIVKKTVKINWQDSMQTESCFTYYQSKNELRITRFGRGFPFLVPEETGSLFVFTKLEDDYFNGYFLETEDEIDSFLDTFNISPTETNRLITSKGILQSEREKEVIYDFIRGLTVDFPPSEEMSTAAREIENTLYNHKEHIISNPDNKIISWTNMEFELFRSLEHVRYGSIISNGFNSVDEFVEMANTVLNRRKSRAGKSLEHHLSAIFDGNQIRYTSQAVTEGKKKPDFIFPSEDAYHDLDFPVNKLVSLAAKTTCKDRWRQVINEADRLRNGNKYLCTLQQGISETQINEMEREKVILVVPKPYISSYPRSKQSKIWTLSQFVNFVKEKENI